MNVQLLTRAERGAYLERVQSDIADAEYFVLVSAFATSDGVALLEPAMRKCLEDGGQGTLVLALDHQHFNGADVFEKLASMVESFPGRLAVRIVCERAGLLHAKAVFTKSADGDATLLVGSANLTEKAFTQNHELGLWVELLGKPEIGREFQRFVQSLGGKPCDAIALRELAGYVRTPCQSMRSPPHPGTREVSWKNIFLTPPTLPSVPIETFVGDWLQAGSIVGRGRRGLDVLVIRTPEEHLARLGLIERTAKRRIAAATEKTMSAGYGVRLLPDNEDDRLRRDARRTRSVLGKLTLNLPCFGLWMPSGYWDVFQQVAERVQTTAISADDIRAAAEQRRAELDGTGIEREVEAIVADLQREGLAKREDIADVRTELLAHFRHQLAQRTPGLIARAVGFRTQRQALASDFDLKVVARSFFVDLIQATFAATYRTGIWPRRFRSWVGREIAERTARRCLSRCELQRDEFAIQCLDGAAAWEDENVSFETVTAQVNQLVGEADDFPIVTIEELLQIEQEGDEDGEDE